MKNNNVSIIAILILTIASISLIILSFNIIVDKIREDNLNTNSLVDSEALLESEEVEDSDGEIEKTPEPTKIPLQVDSKVIAPIITPTIAPIIIPTITPTITPEIETEPTIIPTEEPTPTLAPVIEPTLTPAPTPVPTPVPVPITLTVSDGSNIQNYSSYTSYIEDPSSIYTVNILITTNTDVQNLKLMAGEVLEDGSRKVAYELFNAPLITTQNPLLIGIEFPGPGHVRMLQYVDIDGITKTFSILQHGGTGQVFLQ